MLTLLRAGPIWLCGAKGLCMVEHPSASAGPNWILQRCQALWHGSQGGKHAVRSLRRRPHLPVEGLQLPVSPVQRINLVHVLGPLHHAVQVTGFHGSQGLACLSFLPHALLVGEEHWEELHPVLGDLVPARSLVGAAVLPTWTSACLLAAFTI